MKTWKLSKRVVSFFVVCCISALALSVYAGELPVSLKARVSSAGGYEKLALQAARKGSVRIIVKVEAAFHPMGSLSTAQADEQMRSISRAQEHVMGQLASVNVISHYKYQYIPHIAMTVDAEALDAVLSAAGVSSVEEDKLSLPTLVNWNITKVGAPTAWSSGYDGTGYAVAIIDTGVDKTHPILTGKVVSEACYSTNDSSSYVYSVCPGGVTDSTESGAAMPYAGACSTGKCDHGTHVAGIAAGQNTGQSSGVATGASIIAIQVFSLIKDVLSCGLSFTCVGAYDSDIIKGLERVYALKDTYSIASANMSLGGDSYSDYCDIQNIATKAAIDNLRSAGAATVIASGNDGDTNGISTPGCISTAVSVGATDSSDSVTYYSNSASFLSLLAPGSSIKSSIPNAGYATWGGTSMATPHVTGAWAVLKQARPAASVTEILSALTSTGTSITDYRNNIKKPRLQLDAALNTLLNTYSLSVTKSGTGTGTLTSTPAGISCGSTCSASYTSDTSVTLTAAPSSGSSLTSWSGCDSTNGSQCTVSVTSDKSVTAAFDVLTYSLSVTKSGAGTVTSAPAGISCGSTCSASYTSGTQVVLTATPDSGFTFTGWSGCDSTNGTRCTVSITSAKSVTAKFGLVSYNLTVTKSGTGTGTLTSAPAGISCGTACSASYTVGTSVTLTAAANSGSSLTSWSGCDSSSGSQCTVTVSSAKSVTAVFTSEDHTKASAWINAAATQYTAYFGTKSGSVTKGTDAGGTFYIQWFTNGRAILAYADGIIYFYTGVTGSGWNSSLGLVWNETTRAGAWINAFYSQYTSFFGTKSGGITTGTDTSGTYYIQFFTNGTGLLAWTDGYVYFYSGGRWNSFGTKWK
ncbi:S8 family serine peptidase [Candidatus Magnetominusculus xianensis]|uniref:Subtilisin-like serine protease n=1 Tax=Candidatus Magnetominusculus xianensis TaxID=1748249 RepID=A0ABR5SMW3_9BACT|nr:S8 family serine peptidase [Candidatus Magnetominusculus xianensis]KWT93335.1 subtilisin-like serine protease [Candidatus Magnetominusculus xianensis]MBF0402314.1 S8 family serine peptidase [Nitrospirota bacterium]